MKAKTGRALAPSKFPACVAKGILISMAVTVGGAGIMSGLIIKEVLKETAIGYAAMGTLLTASASGAIAAMNMSEGKKGALAGVTGIGYAAILLLLNALLYPGGYEGVGVTLLLILGGCGAAILIEGNHKNTGNRKKRKRKHR